MKIYLAGSMFSEAEIAARLHEAKMIRERLKDIELYSPIEQPFNENKSSLPTPQDIYNGDIDAIKNCDVIVVDLGCWYDQGVMIELGVAAGLNESMNDDADLSNKGIYIIGHLSDIRVPTANQYPVPSFGYNHLALAVVERYGVVLPNMEAVVKELERINELR